MAIVLTCRRCMQSREIAAESHGETCYCGFCGLEMDLPFIPAARTRPAAGKKRSPRRWPLVAATALLMMIPAGLFAVLALRARSDSQNNAPSPPSVELPFAPIALRPEPTKPERVLSAAVETAAVQDRRAVPLPPWRRMERPELIAPPRSVGESEPVAAKQRPLQPLLVAPKPLQPLTEAEMKELLAHLPMG
jgi:hypothetical protein